MKCGQCGSIYDSKKYLDKHIRKIHKSVPVPAPVEVPGPTKEEEVPLEATFKESEIDKEAIEKKIEEGFQNLISFATLSEKRQLVTMEPEIEPPKKSKKLVIQNTGGHDVISLRFNTKYAKNCRHQNPQKARLMVDQLNNQEPPDITYLEELKTRLPRSQGKTWPLEEEKVKPKTKTRFFAFLDDTKINAYWCQSAKKSKMVSGRHPFKKDDKLKYGLEDEDIDELELPPLQPLEELVIKIIGVTYQGEESEDEDSMELMEYAALTFDTPEDNLTSWIQTRDAMGRMERVMEGTFKSKRHDLFLKKDQRENCGGNNLSQLWMISNPNFANREDDTFIISFLKTFYKEHLPEADPQLVDLGERWGLEYVSTVLFPETVIHQLTVRYLIMLLGVN